MGMPMNQSDYFEAMYSDYIEGTLSPEDQRELEAHLKAHPEAEKTVLQMRQIRAHLSQMPQLKTSNDFEAKLHQKINGTTPNTATGGFLNQYTQNWKMPAMAFATVCAALAFVFFGGNEVVTEPINSGQQGQQSSFSGQEQSFQQIENTATGIQAKSVATKEAKEDSATIDAERLNDKMQLVKGKGQE